MADTPENDVDLQEDQKQTNINDAIDKVQSTKKDIDRARDLKHKFKKPKVKPSATPAPAAGTVPATGAVPAAGAGATGAGAAGAGAATGTSTAAVAGGTSVVGAFFTVVLVIVVILLFVGMIVALVYLPGSIVGIIKGAWKAVVGYIAGEDSAIGQKEYAQVANYLQDRGYDLYAEGFINSPLTENNINDEGKIKSLPKSDFSGFPHLIELLTHKDAYTTRVKNVASFRPFAKGEWAGFLNFYYGDWKDSQLVTAFEFNQGAFRHAITIDREKDKLEVQRKLWGTTYYFDMDGWSGRYGMPLELSLALHQGTRAPDLVRELAKGGRAYDSFSHTKENVDYVEGDVLYYKNPILNILLLEVKVSSKVNFVIPSNTTINGKVYVMNNYPDFDQTYDKNPFDFSASNMIEKTSVTAEEVYKSFFKTEDGKYHRIKPKKPQTDFKLAYFVPGEYNDKYAEKYGLKLREKESGILVDNLFRFNEKNKKYNPIESNYDLSSIYFKEESAGKYVVNNLVGGYLDSKDIDNNRALVDVYGIYDKVAEIAKQNKKLTTNDYVGASTKIREALRLTDSFASYIPMIKNSENHWFRDVYFQMKTGDKYVKEDKDYFLLTGEKWSKYDISEEEGKKILTPQTNTVDSDWSAYVVEQSNNVNQLGQPLVSADGEYDGLEEIIYVYDTQDYRAKQVEEARRGMTNPRTKNLFANTAWYKYDGTEATADEINKDRKRSEDQKDPSLKSLIDTETDLMAGFEILEGAHSLDAQYILRDLKELYVELGYFDKEDLRDPVRRVLRWPLPDYNTPAQWPAADIHKDAEGYGILIPSKSTLNQVYDEKTIKENEEVIGTGFNKGEKVASLVTGKIEEIGKKDVTRIITTKEGETKRVTYSNVGYITISAIDDEAPEEVKKEYQTFYDNEYKGVISGKIKYTKGANRKSRYLKGNKITIEGIDVNIPSDINNPENSKYMRQLSEGTILKIEDKETREEAEKIEQTKINAPNYISLGGENHVGDYIKEGTILGTTTNADIRIIMQDCDKAFIENVDHYIVKDTEMSLSILNDYYTKVNEGELNVVTDIETFKKMFSEYPLIIDNAKVFLDIQKETGVNALFMAAASIEETGAGLATAGINKMIKDKYGGTYNNIFSIRLGSADSSTYPVIETKDSNGEVSYWPCYPDVKTACKEFTKLVSDNYWSAGKYYVSQIGSTKTDQEWADNINAIISESVKKVVDSNSEYYEDIPVTAPVIPNLDLSQYTKERQILVNAAYYLLNYRPKIPYVLGGSSVRGIDCSGLTKYCYAKLGYTLKHGSNYQGTAHHTPKGLSFYKIDCGFSDSSRLAPGDIVLKTIPVPNQYGYYPHVGIYVGNGKVIHSTSWKNKGVTIDDISIFGYKYRKTGVRYLEKIYK